MPPTWYTAGEQFIRTVQAHGNPALDALFRLASLLGEEWFYLLFLPLLYWCLDASLGRWTAYALLLSGYGNSALKHVWNTPRPPESLWRNLVIRPDGPGFPSGHAQISTTVWGTVAWRCRQAWTWAVALGLVAAIAFSRVYNGVHYPHDVVGGLLFGLIGLGALMALGPRVAAIGGAWSPPRTALIVGGFALLLLLAHPPQDGRWPAAAAIPSLATLWGMSVGFAAERKWVRFQTAGPVWQRGLRFVVGIVMVMAAYVGMKALLPVEEPYLAHLVVRAARYALVGLVVAWWAPAVFFHLRLCDSTD